MEGELDRNLYRDDCHKAQCANKRYDRERKRERGRKVLCIDQLDLFTVYHSRIDLVKEKLIEIVDHFELAPLFVRQLGPFTGENYTFHTGGYRSSGL